VVAGGLVKADSLVQVARVVVWVRPRVGWVPLMVVVVRPVAVCLVVARVEDVADEKVGLMAATEANRNSSSSMSN
jgi:hypothetical protein